MTTPEWTLSRVPTIDPKTGRLPDEYAPQPVVDALEQVDAIRDDMLAKHANLGDVPDAGGARANLGAAAASHTHPQSQVVGLGDALAAKADLVDGRIPTSQIPQQSLTHTEAVADEAAMLALTPELVQPGDIAVRADGAGTFVLRDPDPSLIGSWLHLAAPTDAVTSVNGQQGDVLLGAGDVGAATPQQVSEAVSGVELLAEGFAEAAQGSATSAGASASTAAGHAGAAQTARTGAETARAGAEDARDDAQGYRDQTEAAVTTGLSWAGAVDLTTLALAPVLLHATLTGDITVSLPTPPAGRAYTVTLVLAQDATGGHAVGLPGVRASWSVPYAHTGTALSTDVVHLLWTGAYWLVLAAAQKIGVPA